MLTLILFRHAKSSWDDPALKDIDRPLAPRGKKAAPLMGRYLAENDLLPDYVLCSPAARTRQTLQRALDADILAGIQVKYDETLYHGAPGNMLQGLRHSSATALRVMVIGHNPGMHALAMDLIGTSESEEQLNRLMAKFPTAALAVILFDAKDWQNIEPSGGKLIHYATPKMFN